MLDQFRSNNQMCSIKKDVLKNLEKFTGNICVRVSFLIKFQASACNFIKKKNLVKVLSCEFCETFENNFFTENLWVTVSHVF